MQRCSAAEMQRGRIAQLAAMLRQKLSDGVCYALAVQASTYSSACTAIDGTDALANQVCNEL